ncbi:hypothetical protein ACJRO7_026973 [Eucalyptus globulus]|uniref:AAA+ ATPase domain-containing protein n=1 Tax=Eucalyptus globulus TaxID=34317 RepID=A0ABD3JPY3_EUCGL
MSIDAAIAIAWDVLKSVVAPIKRQFGYVIYSKRHADILQEKVRELAHEVDRVHNLAEEARNNLRNVYGHVTEWQASAEKALKEARDLLRDFQEASKTCCYETLPDPKCRYQFSRKAKDKIEVIQQLTRISSGFKEWNDISSSNPAPGNVAALTSPKREGISSSNPAPGNIAALPTAKREGISSSNPAPGNVAALTPANKGEGKDVVQLATVMASASLTSTSTKVRENDVFKSRASITGDIMAALADNNYSVVGVYGMGGVGKSTLLADVKGRIIEKKSFDWVAKADVSENPDVKKIQGEIAHALDLDIRNQEIVSVRAELLHKRLENEEREKKKVLIILDNLWKGLDLKSVGIPCGPDNKVIGCKLLLTSRFEDVLRREMGCDRDFRLEGLKDEEAKRMFERTVGDKAHDDPFKSLVNEAVHKCAGLPFLIIAMANIFKDADFYEWKDVLTQIEKSTDIGISESINKMLQLTYDHFKGKDGEEVKSLLRLCVIYGVSKPSLENLVKYGVGLRLFREDSNMEEVRNRLRSLIRRLKASSLLLDDIDDEDDDGFKIHDLVRGFVASIASKEEPLLVWKDNDESEMELPKDKLKSCTALCFSYVEMEQLPEELYCPETRIFLLFTNNDSLKVPDSYFNSMRKLMVLHLSQVCLTRSPSPFKLLEDLHTLCLDGCSLEDVAMIGELKGLHILSFVNSNIHRLPKEIEQLVELRLLDLSKCSQLEIIEPGVLGSLMKLEELYMWNSFDKWNVMEQTPPTNAELIELGNKKNLHTLHVSIPDLRMLPEDLNVKKLTKYNILIGGARCSEPYKGSSVLELRLHSISDYLQKGCIQTLLGKTDHLLLDKVNGIQSICSLSHEGFQKLKHLYVKYSPSRSNNQVGSQVAFFAGQEVAFPSLETIDISDIDNIEIIWDNQVAVDSFHKLKSLEVWRCSKLLNIVPSCILGRLKRLESLEVQSCDLLEVVFKFQPLNPLDGHPVVDLPLKRLKLFGLPELRCVWDKELHSRVKFQYLRFVRVSGCKSLTSLFPASVVVHLTQLEELKIDKCGIVELIKMEDKGAPEFVFPKLTSLQLQDLTELRCIYIGKYVSHWPALKTLEMYDCHKVEILASHPENDMPFDKQPLFLVEKVLIPSLESLTMAGLPNLENLWTDESPLELSNLQFLKLSSCKSLSKVINSRSLTKLHKLHTLEVEDCISMQEIFDLDELGADANINTIDISQLPSLRRIWNKNPCGIVRFHNLKKLKVRSCENLRFLFFPSMVQSLAQLRELQVRYCKNMEAIIMEEEELRIETLEILVFPMLTKLYLKTLESLTCFSHRKCTPKSQGEDSIKLHSPLLFNQEVAFPSLETINISDIDNIEIIWDNQVAVDSFHKLKSLEVWRCSKLLNIVPSCILGRLKRLESLEVQSCDLLEVVFKFQPLNPLDGHPVVDLPLKRLKLFGLPELRCVWDKELHSRVKFQYLRFVRVSGCKSLTSLFPASVVVHLTQIEELEVRSCDSLEVVFKLQPLNPLDGHLVAYLPLKRLKLDELPKLKCVWDNELHDQVKFQCLRFVTVSGCKSLTSLFPTSVVVHLTQLEELELRSCNSLEVVFKLQPLNPLDGHLVADLPLKRLKLNGLPKLKCVWDKELHSQVKFQCLRFVTVSKCKSLTSLFPASVVIHLTQLEELEISECGIVKLIEKEGPIPKVVFPRLTSLKLEDLIELKCIYTRIHALCWPALKNLEVQGCNKVEILASQPETEMPLCKQPLFLIEKVAFPSLETVDINDVDNIEIIWDNQVAADSFHKLKSLEVRRCNKLLNIVPSCILGRLKSLESLKVKSCDLLEVVFKLQPLNPLDGHPVAHLPLKRLQLDGLPELKCVWDKELHSQVKFQCLRFVTVSGCKSLTSLFPTSVVVHLTQLEELKIDECGIVELIKKEDRGVPRFVFPKLTSLKLQHLTKLRCIYIGKYMSHWPALKILEMCSCHNVEIIVSHPENDMPFDKQPLFLVEKVVFPSLETLYISGMDNIEIIWDNQVAADSFHKLKSLEVSRCNKLLNIVPSCILGRLRSLESLEVGSCDSLEVVFKLQPLNPLDGHPIAHLPLKMLELDGLPKLKCVWDMDLHSQVKFQCLHYVTVSKCKSLASLFPTSVAIHLTELDELKIDECGIVELIEKEDELVLGFVFPKLTSLKLAHLTELKYIYIGKHASHWPALKTLKVLNCDKVEIFASHSKNEMPLHKQPLFLIEKDAFPNLQKLKLDLSGRMEIWHGHFHDGEFFTKLRVLELHHFSKELAIFTCCFVQSLANLEKLIVRKSYREELNVSIEAIAGPSHELEVILPSSFQHLKTLEVLYCDGLSPYEILPFSTFFQHLETLDMSFCDGLSNIFTPTIARNLVKLTKFRISNCKMLTEIIYDEEGEEGLMVAFNQLKCIELDRLIRLRCFSSIKYTLVFPLLEDVIVSRCPGMKFFSRGPIEAPKLDRVQVSIEVWFWKENLNSTIQNMFEEMATVAREEFMRLSEFPEMIGKWHDELNPIKSSWQLKSLMVDKCPSFINVIPSKLMLVLDNMKEIFNLEGLEGVESTRVLPGLQLLDLVNLPKLRQLWNKDLQEMLCFKSLSSLALYNCSNLGHAFAPSMAQCLASLKQMEINECGKMEAIITKEEEQGSAMEKITFAKLRWIKLECLPNLTSFLSTGNHMLDCPYLEDLTIAHCPKMRSLTWQSRMEIDLGTTSLFTPHVITQCNGINYIIFSIWHVQFPCLQSMVLSHMENLSKIWTFSPQETLTFKHLQKVVAQNCKNLENLFPYWVATSLTQLEKLQVEPCGLEEIVTSGDDTPKSTTTQFLIPKLTSLVLHDMPQLKSFCSIMPTLNWPFLMELRVTHCGELNMLSFVASMNKWAQRDNQHSLSDPEAHFSIERGIPTLERLLLVDKDIQMIQNGKFSDGFFGKPKVLTLACFHDENAVFPSIFLLQRFQNLQSLKVFCSSFEDIFPDEGLVDEGKHLMLDNLKELKLKKLHNLKHVWREGYLVAKILQCISKFKVCDCRNLTTLFPVVTSFQNLMELVVKNSSRLVYLVTVSAIANLVHLKRMTIIGCEGMKEVVANDENGEGKVISLRKLRWLTLQNLSSLECFSSTTSCIFKFPCMYSIKVEECPKMKIFCEGVLSTPKLHSVKLFRYKWQSNWAGDLNTTIQKLTT